jgi:hypothetical protein
MIAWRVNAEGRMEPWRGVEDIPDLRARECDYFGQAGDYLEEDGLDERDLDEEEPWCAWLSGVGGWNLPRPGTTGCSGCP